MIRAALLFSAMAVILLAGCATSPISAERADPAYAVFAFQGAGEASIQVTRDAGILGAACSAVVYIDGIKAAEIDSGQTARFNVSAGEHIVSAAMSAGLCNAGMRETQIDVAAGEEERLRISLGGAGDLNITPTAF